MKVIGITGGIGSGKTTVCRLFESLGVPVYYADDRAKFLMENDPEVMNRLLQLFGTEAFTDNKLNRKWIASQVFNNAALLEKLNSIVHPAVASDLKKWVKSQADFPYCLKEAALLVESGSYKQADKLIVVTAPDELRIRRVMERDNLSREQVLARIRHQLPQSEKASMADYLIVNDGTQMLIPQIIAIHRKLLEEVTV